MNFPSHHHLIRMSLWRLYYHLVWATQFRQAVILPEYERSLYDYIIGKSDSLNSIVHAINGISDHIDIIVSIPPQVAIYDYVKQIKGGSSHYINQEFVPSNKLTWQKGYGIFSISQKNLDTAIRYVDLQKEHHKNQTAIAALEKMAEIDDPPIKYRK